MIHPPCFDEMGAPDGAALDVPCYRRDSLTTERRFQITVDDSYFAGIRERHRTGIGKLFDQPPEPDWEV